MRRQHRSTPASCRSVARQIDVWLDARCPVALPEAAAEHLRVCEACRKRVTEWNAVELRLRSLRDEWPRTSSTAPISAATVRREATLGTRRDGRRLAYGVAVASAALALLTAGVMLYSQLDGRRERAIAARAVAENASLGERAIDAFRRDLPVAHTR